jgi:hypothetical protein
MLGWPLPRAGPKRLQNAWGLRIKLLPTYGLIALGTFKMKELRMRILRASVLSVQFGYKHLTSWSGSHQLVLYTPSCYSGASRVHEREGSASLMGEHYTGSYQWLNTPYLAMQCPELTIPYHHEQLIYLLRK